MTAEQIFHFNLPIPPSANLIWRSAKRFGRQRIYRSKEYNTWERQAHLILKDITIHESRHWQLEIEFFLHYVKSIANMDMDNRIKPLVDFIKTKIGIDDRYLKRILCIRHDVQIPTIGPSNYCLVTLKIF